MMEKNIMAKKIFICGLGPDEYNRILACSNAKKFGMLFKRLMKEQIK